MKLRPLYSLLLHGLWLCVLTVSALLLLAGCGLNVPTPTPTKTPVEQTDTLASSTDTPMPPPPTNTPMPPPPTNTPIPPQTANTVPIPVNSAPYTGLAVEDVSLLAKSPIFICINNDSVSRTTHYGLNAADVTYEYIVDGYTLTRLTSMYQSTLATRIGPVRSARLPNIWMTYMYDGVLACSGASEEVRYLLKNEVGFPYLDADIDDPSNTVYFFSLGIDFRTRLQGSTGGVRNWLQDMAQRCQNPDVLAPGAQEYCERIFHPRLMQNGELRPWAWAGFTFNQIPPDFSAGEASTIHIPYPGGNSVEWRYDPTSTRYLRYQGGAPHIDQATGQQISSDNVIVIFAEHELTDIVEDSFGTLGVDIQLYGFGDLRIFRNGKFYEGTWRANDQSPPRWLGPGERTITLKPGRSWVQVVRTTDTINY